MTASNFAETRKTWAPIALMPLGALVIATTWKLNHRKARA